MRSGVALLSGLLAVAYIAAQPSPSRGELPADLHALAARVGAHPADWLAASALAERALDAPVHDPLALWRASGALAISLAPSLPPPRNSFARAGFFHWNELSAADRNLVLDAYAPVLHDQFVFLEMARVIFELTGDFGYLRRVQPRQLVPTRELAALAVANGRFDDYRVLRRELETLDSRTPRPPDYGLEAWSGLCGENICLSGWRAVEAARGIAITVATMQSDRVEPYVEIYVDGVRRAEGSVRREQTFIAPVDSAREHQVEVRLANPRMLDNRQRQIRVTAMRAL
jgi:hypothetical protein